MASSPAKKDIDYMTQGAPNACPACGAEGVRLKNVDGMMICDKCASKKFSSKVRKSIQEAFDKQQEQVRKEAYNRRLQITRMAHDAIERDKPLEAINLYEKYLEVLNSRFKTTTETLHPHLFDKKSDEQELLLVTAVMWDLARTLDRIKGKDKEFRFYLNKYVQFSMGAKFMVLSAETLRRYIKNKSAVHSKDFENAHNALRNNMGRCFIAGVVYGEDAEETRTLQKFRDKILERSRAGRAFTRIYYATSPRVACWLVKYPRVSKLVKKALDRAALPVARRKISD